MIQLGLAKIGNWLTLKHREPVSQEPAELSQELAHALAETVAWCARKNSVSHDLRSPELDPSKDLIGEAFPETAEAIRAWSERRENQYASAILRLRRRRSELLERIEPTVAVPNESAKANGRLLIYFPSETVTCGASQASSQGFFDGEDAPPWDTWFCYSNKAILCWIPNDLIPRAEAGIRANPVDCIHWPGSNELSHLTRVNDRA